MIYESEMTEILLHFRIEESGSNAGLFGDFSKYQGKFDNIDGEKTLLKK